jgi:hypothetical protein
MSFSFLRKKVTYKGGALNISLTPALSRREKE